MCAYYPSARLYVLIKPLKVRHVQLVSGDRALGSFTPRSWREGAWNGAIRTNIKRKSVTQLAAAAQNSTQPAGPRGLGVLRKWP